MFFGNLQKQKQALRVQLEAASKTRDAARDATRELKSMIKFKDVEDIEAEIQKLEDEISHSSLSLNEERRVMESIRQLKNSKSIVADYGAKMDDLSTDEKTCKEINAAIKSLDVEITKIRKEEDEHRAAMNAEKKKEEASGTDNQTLWNEKEKCREACKEAYEKIKDLRASFDQEWQEFKAKEKIWKAQQAVEKAKKREEYLKEKAARDAERAAREKEMAPDPFTKEIIVCEQLASYLSKFAGDAVKESDTVAGSAGDQPSSLDGMKVLTKKGDDPDMTWMLGAGKKKGKGKKATSKQGADEKLIHTVDILSAFASLNLSVPITKSDCSTILKEVNEKKQYYVQKQAAAKEGDGEEAESLPENEEPETASDASEQKQKTSGKSKKSTPATLKLDDEQSWPSMGGLGAESTTTHPQEEAAVENEELEEGEVLPTPKTESGDKASGFPVEVSLKVDEKSSAPISVQIS